LSPLVAYFSLHGTKHARNKTPSDGPLTLGFLPKLTNSSLISPTQYVLPVRRICAETSRNLTEVARYDIATSLPSLILITVLIFPGCCCCCCCCMCNLARVDSRRQKRSARSIDNVSTPTPDKKLSYRRGTARCVLSVEILPTATQQCRNYLYYKS